MWSPISSDAPVYVRRPGGGSRGRRRQLALHAARHARPRGGEQRRGHARPSRRVSTATQSGVNAAVTSQSPRWTIGIGVARHGRGRRLLGNNSAGIMVRFDALFGDGAEPDSVRIADHVGEPHGGHRAATAPDRPRPAFTACWPTGTRTSSWLSMPTSGPGLQRDNVEAAFVAGRVGRGSHRTSTHVFTRRRHGGRGAVVGERRAEPRLAAVAVGEQRWTVNTQRARLTAAARRCKRHLQAARRTRRAEWRRRDGGGDRLGHAAEGRHGAASRRRATSPPAWPTRRPRVPRTPTATARTWPA